MRMLLTARVPTLLSGSHATAPEPPLQANSLYIIIWCLRHRCFKWKLLNICSGHANIRPAGNETTLLNSPSPLLTNRGTMLWDKLCWLLALLALSSGGLPTSNEPLSAPRIFLSFKVDRPGF
ncbi:hypothetical protein D4764_04G0006480 [Takifugu flavidus]|uniref:Uncharacterized protein n=1 Tax=Takifugu flavidus TaxID=433684 RepID=A0A5C6N6W7_9TELE|nr:hypothetical protein D4764_04G0006480 [Takifugu flavidus]